LINEQNRFVIVNGTKYMFEYHNLIMSWVSRGGGRRWCKVIRLGNTVKEFLISLCSTMFEWLQF